MLNGDLSKGKIILYLNPHIFNLAQKSPILRQALLEARITSADGMGIVLCSPMFLPQRLVERCNMTEVFREFLEDSRFSASNAVLIGGLSEEAKQAAQNIEKVSKHCKIIKHISGYLEESEYQHILAETDHIDIVLLGMGTPKSEQIAQMAARTCPCAVIWHIGGGTILFYAGRLKEAPAWMRRTGLQWVHRLFLEPRRMWRRYLLGNCVFLFRIFTLWTRRGFPWNTKAAAKAKPAG